MMYPPLPTCPVCSSALTSYCAECKDAEWRQQMADTQPLIDARNHARKTIHGFAELEDLLGEDIRIEYGHDPESDCPHVSVEVDLLGVRATAYATNDIDAIAKLRKEVAEHLRDIANTLSPENP